LVEVGVEDLEEEVVVLTRQSLVVMERVMDQEEAVDLA
jgi:hypothetical protein